MEISLPQERPDGLATGLGVVSLALGAAPLLAPRRVARLIGVHDRDRHALVMRGIGLQELTVGAGILTRKRPTGWLWARVMGDVMHLGLLAAADSKRPGRTTAAAGAVAGVLLPDALEAVRLSFVEKHADGDSIHVKQAITVQKPAHETYGFWHDFANLPQFMEHLESVEVHDETRSHWVAKGPLGKSVEWDAEIVDDRPDELISWRSVGDATVDNRGSVTFREAPGGRGTEVVVELRYSPPAGTLGATVAKLLGEEPATQLSDDLRRFKQVLETGEVVRSAGTPTGHSLRGHAKRPAQPLPASEVGA